MREVIACDAGGPIKVGDFLHCTGPFVSKRTGGCCVMIALTNADFLDSPIENVLVFDVTTPHLH